MTLIKRLLLVLLPLSGLTAATPIKSNDVEARDLFQVNPSLDKRTLFNVENIQSDEQKKYLQDAQKEAVDIAAVALEKFDDPKYAGYLAAWFGPDREGWPMGEVEDDVRGVLTNFVGGNANGEGSVVLGDVKVWQDDYLPLDPKFCDQERDGKTPTAYYSRTRKGGLGPSMHYCDKFFNRKSKADYLANNCGSIANPINTDTTTRQYRGANVLHEFMHYGKVSEGQVGAQVDDYAYGAYKCLSYKDTENGQKHESRPALNADTYVFFAIHIWLSEECKKTFSYPRGPQDD